MNLKRVKVGQVLVIRRDTSSTHEHLETVKEITPEFVKTDRNTYIKATGKSQERSSDVGYDMAKVASAREIKRVTLAMVRREIIAKLICVNWYALPTPDLIKIANLIKASKKDVRYYGSKVVSGNVELEEEDDQ